MKAEHITKILNDFFEEQPNFDISYLEKIGSPFGIYQHATCNIPNYNHGYCLDDNSRALLLLVKAQEIDSSIVNHRLVNVYLSFILYAQSPDGTFKNFMSFDLNFLENKGSEDSTGRAIWAIGTLLGNPHFAPYHDVSREIFNRSLDHLCDLTSPRAIGYSLLGILKFIEANPDDVHAIQVAKTLAGFLENEFEACFSLDWPWFEEVISYDNAILPLAMLQAGRILENRQWRETGLASFSFLDATLFSGSHCSIIGNQGWFKKGGKASRTGQQPVEIPSIMLLYREVYLLDKNVLHLQKIRQAFLWYLGENDMGTPLYNPVDRSCYDGLEDFGVNKNQGAESNIAFWTAYILAKGIQTISTVSVS